MTIGFVADAPVSPHLEQALQSERFAGLQVVIGVGREFGALLHDLDSPHRAWREIGAFTEEYER